MPLMGRATPVSYTHLANFKDTIIKLYEGKFATGQEFAEAMDALY